MNERRAATSATWPLPPPAGTAIVDESGMRRFRMPAGSDPASVLADRQLAMATLTDWLPIVVERSLAASWNTREPGGVDRRFQVEVSTSPDGVLLEERILDHRREDAA